MVFWKKSKEKQEPTKPGIGEIENIVAIASGKGGVGKSTVTTNLAYALSQKGYKVGVLDADLYGPSQPMMMGKNERATAEGNYAIPIENRGVKFISLSAVTKDDTAAVMRGPMAVKVIHQFLSAVLWGKLDYLLIDLPPGTGDIQLTLAQQARLTGGIIITTPQKVALDISKKALDMFNTVNIPILGIVENMSGFTCQHCGEVTEIFKKGGGKESAEKLEVPFLGEIPLDPVVMMSGDDGSSILDSEEKSDSHVKKIFQEIAENVVGKIKKLKEDTSIVEPEKIQVYEDTGKLNVHWNNGEESELDAYQLRLECPCAQCVDEVTGEKTLDKDSISLDVKVKEAKSVGRYGLSLSFSDGHNTGIYKISTLRELASMSEEISL